MKKKLLLRLCLMTAIVVSLYSCMSDEITLQENPSEALNTARFSSKSLWEEDEKYISKVKEVYGKNADENYIQQTYGTIFWDYATTMDQFDESYLMVPVLKNNRVVNILEVFREKNRVYFQFSADDLESNEFFQTLIFDRGKIKAAESSVNKNVLAKGGTITVSVCKKYTIIVGYVEGASGEQYPIESTKTICKFVDMAIPASQCLGIEDPATGECMGGGTGAGSSGYEYPEPPEEDPCEKVKDKFSDPRVKSQFDALNTQDNFDKDHEEGFFERASKINDINTQSFTPVTGPPCSGYINLPAFKKGITGFGHTHNNYDCNGKGNILAPSPADLMAFLFTMVKQAGNFYGDFSKAYYFTITSGGNYMFQYSGGIAPQNLSFNIAALNKEYKNIFSNLRNRYPDMPQNKVEEAFAKFLKEEVNIEGLELYKVTPSSTEKLEYNSDTKILTKTPCPN